MDQDNTLNSKLSIANEACLQCPKCKALFARNVAYCTSDGTKLEDADSSQTTASVFAGKYEILNEIGSGGMGTVYRVRQILLDKICALKVIPAESLTDLLITRFQREAKTMATLDHPNLGRILDFGIYQNSPYMVMEYVDGKPLNKLILETELSIEEVIGIFSQVLDGLAHAHKKGVLHRDIKPSNIMIVPSSPDQQTKASCNHRAILLDFGIAKKIEPSDDTGVDNFKTQGLTRTGEMIGSPLYMSPEQAHGEKLTERSDLYSVGCALFECLAGTAPFVGKSTVDTLILHMEKPVPTLKEASLGREFPGGLERAIKKMLSKNPSDRYQTADETKRALALAIQLEDKQADIKAPDKSDKIISRTTIILVCLAVLISVSVIASITIQGEKFARDSKPILKEDKIEIEKTWLTVADKAIYDGKQEADTNINSDEDEPEKRINLKEPAAKETQYVPLTGNEETLALRGQILEIKRVRLIQQDRRLQRLGLAQAHFPHSMLGNLQGSLKVLRLSDANITDDDMKYVGELRTLERLHLNANPITSSGLKHVESLRSLHFLDLGGTKCDASGLSSLRYLSQLRNLSLNNNRFIDDKAVELVSTMNGLEELNLTRTKVTGKGIAYLSRMDRLSKLHLGSLRLRDKDIITIKNLPSLSVLYLGRNSISPKGLKHLTSLKLSSLNLDYNPIDDTAIDTILQMRNLRHLSLSSTKMTKNGLKKLTALPALRVLIVRQIDGLEEGFAHDFLTECKNCQEVVFLRERGSGYRRSEWQLDERTKKNSNNDSVK
ncbi:MAG: hypothetical protein C0469_09855 [Cyanobacteria bacterium DS2.3.42]|nr:hypothetical protein [Cyanobacteria bacterium DS2.3.42]